MNWLLAKNKSSETRLSSFLNRIKYTACLVFAGTSLLTPVKAAPARGLTTDSRRALRDLVAKNSAAATIRSKALAVLVFPMVVKAGFVVGAQGGKGVLFVRGIPSGRYRTVSVSYGLQAGVQEGGYALFFMDEDALAWTRKTRGWEIGSGPSVVVVDKGIARTLSTTTLHSGIYAFTFDQTGLMAGLAIQGSKIKKID